MTVPNGGVAELVDIRDIPAYKQAHGLRTIGAKWPLIADKRAQGGMRPAEPNPTLFVDAIEPQEGNSP